MLTERLTMYIVRYTSPSGDHYLMGPWPTEPSQAEILAVFRKHTSDEADYAEELGVVFEARKLSDAPGVVDFQM